MRGNNGRQRGGSARGGFNGGRAGQREGERTYSSSSGSSGGQRNLGRPVLVAASASRGRATPPNQRTQGPSRTDSPVMPITPDMKEHSEFALGSNTIRETYTPRKSTASTPSRIPAALSTPVTPTRYSNQGSPQNNQGSVQVPRPVTSNSQKHWSQQEHKVRIVGLPTSCWTKDVYDAMSRYGNVVRVDMVTGHQDMMAYVTFQYVRCFAWPANINFNQASPPAKSTRANGSRRVLGQI